MNEKNEQLSEKYVYWVDQLKGAQEDTRLSTLEKQWQGLDIDRAPSVENRKISKRTSGNLLGMLSMLIQDGSYPPPELLLCISDCYNDYISSKGAITLEEAFYGKPKKRIGSYAARLANKISDVEFAFFLGLREKENIPRIQIAEEFIRQNNLDIDPESLLRNFVRKTSIKKGYKVEIETDK